MKKDISSEEHFEVLDYNSFYSAFGPEKKEETTLCLRGILGAIRDCLLSSADPIRKAVYHTVNGLNEFTIIGNMRYWDKTEELHKIEFPTPVTDGRYDAVPPKAARSIHKVIKGSKPVTIRELPSSNVVEMENYIKTIAESMKSVDYKKGRRKNNNA